MLRFGAGPPAARGLRGRWFGVGDARARAPGARAARAASTSRNCPLLERGMASGVFTHLRESRSFPGSEHRKETVCRPRCVVSQLVGSALSCLLKRFAKHDIT